MPRYERLAARASKHAGPFNHVQPATLTIRQLKTGQAYAGPMGWNVPPGMGDFATDIGVWWHNLWSDGTNVRATIPTTVTPVASSGNRDGIPYVRVPITQSPNPNANQAWFDQSGQVLPSEQSVQYPDDYISAQGTSGPSFVDYASGLSTDFQSGLDDIQQRLNDTLSSAENAANSVTTTAKQFLPFIIGGAAVIALIAVSKDKH